MDYRSEAALERLVELADNPAIDELTVLKTWRMERLAKRIEHEKQMKRLAGANPVRYGLQRIAKGKVETGGTFMATTYAAEYRMVNEEDVYDFAKDNGLPVTGLWEVLRGQRLQIGDWRSYDGRGSASKVYVDRSEEVAERARLAKEDKQTEARVKQLNEDRREAISPQPGVPVYSMYRKDHRY